MMDNEYDAKAAGVKLEEITSCKDNQNVLCRLKDNDPTFIKLTVVTGDGGNDEYQPTNDNPNECGWLGYFIGENSELQELHLKELNHSIGDFCRGISRNTSIRKVTLDHYTERNCDEEFQMLVDSIFKYNSNLREVELEDCWLGWKSCHALSLAIEKTSASLTHFSIDYSDTEQVGDLESIIISLGMHPQLEEISLTDDIEKEAYISLAPLLSGTTLQNCKN